MANSVLSVADFRSSVHGSDDIFHVNYVVR